MAEESEKTLEVDTEQRGPVLVVRIKGSVGIIESETLAQKLEELADRQIPTMVLDLSEMDFICSSGLGAIISGHLRSRHHDGEIRLVDPLPPVRELLETTRLTKLFPLYESVDEAIKG